MPLPNTLTPLQHALSQHPISPVELILLQLWLFLSSFPTRMLRRCSLRDGTLPLLFIPRARDRLKPSGGLSTKDYGAPLPSLILAKIFGAPPSY